MSWVREHQEKLWGKEVVREHYRAKALKGLRETAEAIREQIALNKALDLTRALADALSRQYRRGRKR